MNAQPHREPAGDLDARIRAVEARLIEREERLGLRLAALGTRVRRAVEPRRLLQPLLGALLGIAGLWWLLRSGSPRPREREPRERVAAPAAAGHAMPWAHVVAFVWPLLPARWRARVSPGVASAAVSIGLPLLEAWLVRPAKTPPLPTMPAVDLARYAGTWFEIARLPVRFESAREGQPSATYTWRGRDSMDVLEQFPAADGSQRSAHGVAQALPDSGGAKLQVNLLPAWLRRLPFGWGEQWILYVDPDYTVALVGNPSRERLWVLAREPRLAEPVLQAVVEIARERGFAVERLLFSQPA